MKSHPAFYAAALLALALAAVGCSTFKMNPVTDETRQTYPVKDDAIYVVVRQNGIHLNDSKVRTYGVLIPPGLYKLEAQDDDYLYFATSGVITRFVYDGYQLVDQNVCQGGVMIGRKTGMLVPAGVYKNDGSMNHVMIWKLTDDFMKMEGSRWELHQHDDKPQAKNAGLNPPAAK